MRAAVAPDRAQGGGRGHVRWRWLIALWLWLLPALGWAGAATVSAACSVDKRVPIESVKVLRDEAGTATAERIRRLPADAFQTVAAGQYLGNGDDIWWLRLTLHNAGSQSCQRWLVVTPPRAGDVRVYVPDDGGWKRMVSGSSYPFSEWALAQRQLVFPVSLKPGTTTVLAQVVHRGGALALTPQLWSPQQFLRDLNRRSLTDGLVAGAIIVLVWISLALSVLYWRPPLLYMALATGLYVLHVALQRNYLFVHVWPAAPAFNHWLRFFVMGAHFVAFFAYLYSVVDVGRLHRRLARFFYSALAAFALLALFGGLVSEPSWASFSIIGLYQGLIWLLAGVVAYNWVCGTDRRWFPPLLIGAICLRGVVLFGQLIGLSVDFWGAEYVSAPMMLILGLFLFGTLFSQARKGRLAQLRARAALDQQRAVEAKRLQRMVAQRTGQLAHLLKRRRQLLGRVNHDLRVPLAGLRAGARQWRAGSASRDDPDRIERHARQQADRLDELLELSRTESAQLELQPAPGYLYAFLNRVADRAELTTEQNGQWLRRDFADDLPALVSVDFHYLQRALINLISHVGKLTDRGTIRFAVRAQPGAVEGQVQLRFRVDNTDRTLADAFRGPLPSPSGDGAGTTREQDQGVGLALVAELLAGLGGRLRIGSLPKGGQRFQFSLELDRAIESELEPVIEEGGVLDIDGAGRVVLVVDDERQQREVTCDLLDSYGFDSLPAAGGEAALQLLRKRPVALVLADQNMAGMDGWELLRAVRHEQPDLSVVLYSSVPPRPPAGDSGRLVFDATLLKPASGVALIEQIDTLLRRAGGPSPSMATGETS